MCAKCIEEKMKGIYVTLIFITLTELEVKQKCINIYPAEFLFLLGKKRLK